MALTRVAVVILALGVVGSPLTALHCSGDSPAAKACCETDGSTCNQPGQADDCCRVTPGAGSDQGLLPVSKADVKTKVPALLAALPVPPAGWHAATTLVLVLPNAASVPRVFPPKVLVLRI